MTFGNNISEIKPFSITVHFFEWNLNEMPGVLKQKIDSSIKMIKTWPGSSKKYQQIKLLIWQRVLWWWHRLSMCPLFYIFYISKLFKWYWWSILKAYQTISLTRYDRCSNMCSTFSMERFILGYTLNQRFIFSRNCPARSKNKL